jgi:predicted HicB family RNase H-like nuclease
MRPDEGAGKQIEIYRRMSGRQRLAIAFEMWEMALAMAKASEKALNPHLSEREIEERARKRMTHGTTGSHSLVD